MAPRKGSRLAADRTEGSEGGREGEHPTKKADNASVVCVGVLAFTDPYPCHEQGYLPTELSLCPTTVLHTLAEA